MAIEQSDRLVIDFSKLYVPTEQQAKAHMAEERYTLFGGAMGGGKSIWGCAEGIQLSLDFPKNRGYACRHENVVFRKTTLLTLEEVLPTDAVANHNKQDQYFDFLNGSRLYYGGLRPTQSEKPLDRIKSMELGWFFIDEASETTRQSFLILSSRLLRLGHIPAKANRGLLASNPEPGWLKNDFVDNPIPDSIFIPALPKDNPHLNPDYESGLRRTFGTTAGWVERYLEGDWNAVMGMGGAFYVFGWGMIRAATEREVEVGEPVEMGVDVARGGTDKTVVYLRRGCSVMLLLDARISNTMGVAEAIRPLIFRYEPSTVRVDAIGIGAGVCDRLTQWFGSEIIRPFIAGGKAVEGERFFNARSEALWMLRDRFERGEISIPDDPELKGQLSSIRYVMRADKKIAAEPKEDMKKRGMSSPDKLDALTYAFGGATPPDVDVWFG